jgi:uncharacterized membrane protein
LDSRFSRRHHHRFIARKREPAALKWMSLIGIISFVAIVIGIVVIILLVVL